jgi:hypothetical protein
MKLPQRPITVEGGVDMALTVPLLWGFPQRPHRDRETDLSPPSRYHRELYYEAFRRGLTVRSNWLWLRRGLVAHHHHLEQLQSRRLWLWWIAGVGVAAPMVGLAAAARADGGPGRCRRRRRGGRRGGREWLHPDGSLPCSQSRRKWPHADCSDGEADARAAKGVNGPLCGRSGKQHRQQTRAPPGACSSPGAGACSRRLAPRCLSAPAVIERACLRPRRSAPRLVRRPGAAVNGRHGPLPESAGFPRRSCGRGVRGRLACARVPPHTPCAVRHVPQHTRMTAGRAG